MRKEQPEARGKSPDWHKEKKEASSSDGLKQSLQNEGESDISGEHNTHLLTNRAARAPLLDRANVFCWNGGSVTSRSQHQYPTIS